MCSGSNATLLVPGDVTVLAAPPMVRFEGSREALLALAGNLRKLAITIEREVGNG